jgi:pimeloyl-ACP methyl ester carboxylesterase
MRIGKPGIKLFAIVAILFMPILAAENAAQAQKKATGQKAAGAEKPSIVLIHGAFADGSSWQEVIPLLQKEGYQVTAAQLPLTSYDADVDVAKRLILGQKGPVVAVGHSYGGAVISAAAAGNPNVKGLVFVAAFALDKNESANELGAKFPKMPLGDALVPDAAEYLTIDRVKFRTVFAQDLPEAKAAVLAAVQKPIANTAFTAAGREPAWKSIPSWFLITTDDRAVNPELQRFEAKRMSAHVTEIKSSHLPMFSKPKDVAKIIESAAKEEVAMGNPE